MHKCWFGTSFFCIVIFPAWVIWWVWTVSWNYLSPAIAITLSLVMGVVIFYVSDLGLGDVRYFWSLTSMCFILFFRILKYSQPYKRAEEDKLHMLELSFWRMPHQLIHLQAPRQRKTLMSWKEKICLNGFTKLAHLLRYRVAVSVWCPSDKIIRHD